MGKGEVGLLQRLKQAGEIIGVEVLDNLIITPNGKFYSEKQGDDV